MLNKDKIDQILRELHFMDSSIDLNDEKLQEIIWKMLKNKPFHENKTFKSELKKSLIKEIKSQKKTFFSFNMFKNLGVLLSWLAFTYAIFTIVNPAFDIKPIQDNSLKSEESKEMNSKLSNDLAQVNMQKEDAQIEDKKEWIKSNKLALNNVWKTNLPEIKKANPQISKKEEIKDTPVLKSENTNISPVDTSKTETTDNIESLDTMMKSTRMSDESLSDSQNQDESFSLDSNIMSDSMPMWLMALPEKKEFNQVDFLNFLIESNSFSWKTIDLIKTSEMKLDNDLFTIKLLKEDDFNILNTEENIIIIKEKLSDFYWFYWEIKLTY